MLVCQHKMADGNPSAIKPAKQDKVSSKLFDFYLCTGFF